MGAMLTIPIHGRFVAARVSHTNVPFLIPPIEMGYIINIYIYNYIYINPINTI
jgi:hypothetical protein